ncbi:M16 family metallopeptidase [Algimonas porphyrae]|uniref:M16 family metallopeptidase n=1 Tax=Algimonas porphyrae TaxID=1128113 RepID=UPI00352B1E14
MTFRSILLSGTATILLAACANATTDTTRTTVTQTTTVTTDTASESTSFTLDYESFMLDNGLEVILQRDTSDPIVAVSTVIHAGSSREKPGRTGFAHFFEHMAFNDSENVPRGWNRGQIPKWGGLRNGGTWSDGTIYFEVVPKDAFDKILWIDSDRLGYMINTVTTAALEREKQVVKNEKRQRVDNAAYGYTNEVIRAALYPEDHPYNWTVIGSLPDLQAATLEDVREFYDLWYGPNNATLAIVGDIDIAETKEKVKRWFGEIERGRDIPEPVPQPVTLEATKNLWFEDNFAKLPELRLTFPTVESLHADQTALDMLGPILGGARNSPLYVEVVEVAKAAPDVSAFHGANELAGTFTIRVRGKAGTDLDDVKAAIDAAMERFETSGIDPQDLERVKAGQETSLYAGLSTALGKANSFARSNELFGDPAHVVKAASAIKAVTADQVRDVYDRYIKDKPYVMTSFVPKGQADLAVSGAERATVWIEEVRDDVASEEVSAGEIAAFEKTPTVHDRSEPPFSELPLLQMPDIWEDELADGVAVRGIESDEIPLVQFDVTLPGGRWVETPEENGRLTLLADMLDEGTANRTPVELEQAIGLLGSSISVTSNSEELVITATTLSRNLDATVALVEEMLTQPRFADADFERVKSARLTAIKGREANPRAIAAQAFNRLIYGDRHPYGRPGGGSVETVTDMTFDDVKAAHADLLSSKARIHVVGAVTPDRAVEALAPLGGAVTPAAMARPDYAIPTQSAAGQVYFIDVPGSKQSVLRIGALVPAADHPDFNKISFTNEKLGGGISGDLGQMLRIEKGYTYGAGSFVSKGVVERPFTLSTSVRANATGDSLSIIRDMVQAHGSTYDAAAVETTQQKVIKEGARAFESLGAKLGTLREISRFNLPNDYVEQEQAELVTMTADDFRDTADRYLVEDAMVYLVVGDAETQLDAVQAFATAAGKGKVVQLDIYGQPVD